MIRLGQTLQATCAIAILFATASLRAAVPGDEHWDAQFGWPGPGGNNYAIVAHNGRIYVSGLGATTNVALQVWDGAQWSPMSQFYGSLSSSTAVFDLAVFGGILYAAGQFTNVNGIAANGLAKWDGTNWSSIGFKGIAYSIAADAGNLYVGGSFTTNLAGLAMKNVARWDGASWLPLGSGLGSTNLSIVYAIAATNGNVYAGGYFTNSGSVLATNVARWNGVGWFAMGNGLDNIVFSLAVKGTDVYAAGRFGSSPYSAVARWDGANWSLLGGGFNSGGARVSAIHNPVFATGGFFNGRNRAFAVFVLDRLSLAVALRP